MTGPVAGPPRLEARGIIKHFEGIKALDGVDFDVRGGEVHCLCGENGAGKSTLIKVLSGLHPAGSYGGRVLVDGQPARFHGPGDATRAGIGVIHQELALAEELSVAENLFLGDLPRRGPFVDWPRTAREAARLLAQFGVDVVPETPARELGVGRKQQVEILKAVRRESRVLILDEPTAALGEAEARDLLRFVHQLAREGVACVYITHRLAEVEAIADRVTVLRDGRSVAAFPTGRVPRAELIHAMAGRPVAESAPRRVVRDLEPGETLLEVASLDVGDFDAPGRPPRLKGIGFELRAGEVLGLAGLMGSGRTELLMHLFGAWGRRIGGSVRLFGKPHDRPDPRESLSRGMAFLGEDRRRFGLVSDQSIEFNLTLSALRRVCRGGRLDAAAEARLCRETAQALRIRSAGIEAPVRTLSGGNQQKVLFGRAMLAEPRVLLLDEPTRGVDVAAKFEISDIINELTSRGAAVLLATSELPELIGLSDRLLVLRDGQIQAQFDRPPFDPRRILASALGHGDRTDREDGADKEEPSPEP